MATEQEAIDKKKVGVLGERDAGGLVYTAIGAIHVYSGKNVPTHAARKGSMYVNRTTGKLHVCVTADTVNASSWETVTSG
jgi:nitroimidazol reductase NimA-like FMN-containing flavoprotein (pyridoxamine 5'-phosphate oxidase superfamily)